ncbi:IS256 family transposase [Microbulbifer aggregans]|uniref:IS256 family transposase n=1 Tax=Microbulbifer aggregans TaxID=1769779 RepID=UPI001CFC4748|nr:IS256 family transposase [Microbulbifer aggregans]
MTCDNENTASTAMAEILSEQGFDGLASALEVLLNELMLIEREQYLGAAAYERSEGRRGHANGFKPKRMRTRVGELELQVPQTRDSQFYPSVLEKGMRCERALRLALAEAYVQGVSTRKMAKVTEELCGLSLSSTQVSRAAKLLDKELENWRSRELGSYPYLYLDARYEKVRHGGGVVDCAVLVAMGVDDSGQRDILGCSVSLSEAEVHWRAFLQSLVQRGLRGVTLIVSDAHEGLRSARKAVFGGTPWQRCQFHLQQNAQAHVPRQDMKQSTATELKAVFNAPNEHEAKRLLNAFVERHEKAAPKLAKWAEDNIPEGLMVFQLPEAHQRRLRTSNPLERVNRELKRRTRVATLFPNEESCLRLVSAVAMEIAEEWQTSKKYLTM